MAYCINCGKEVTDDRKVCTQCSGETETKRVETNEAEPVSEVVNNTQYTKTVKLDQKSKVAAGLFGIFLGTFGVHNFYLGYVGKGVAQLLITVCSCGFLSPVSGIWGLIEGILVLTGDTKTDANGTPLKD